MRYALVCFAAGSIAGVFAFLGETHTAVAETLFLLFFLAGLVLIGWGDPRSQRKRPSRFDGRFGNNA